VKHLGVKEVQVAPRSPWQNPYAERVIGSIRRDVLDHVMVLNERHLHRVLQSYVNYYHTWRVHRALDMDAPDPWPVQPPELGQSESCRRSAVYITIMSGGQCNYESPENS
jgi:transposase InsO family protein